MEKGIGNFLTGGKNICMLKMEKNLLLINFRVRSATIKLRIKFADYKKLDKFLPISCVKLENFFIR